MASEPDTYKIDYCGQEYSYVQDAPKQSAATDKKQDSDSQEKEIVSPYLESRGWMIARKTFRAGEQVVLYYFMLATDTDYRFLLDGEQIFTEYETSKGYIIRFTMPEHDVKLQCQIRNSMSNPPGEWHETRDANRNAAYFRISSVFYCYEGATYCANSFLMRSVSIGTILCRSPTIPRSATEKIGAYLSLLIATMKSDSSIPARCWMAPLIPQAI